jgi:hypothetical protein
MTAHRRPRATVAYHGHCFDGMASAALLTAFLRADLGPGTRFRWVGLDHQPGGSHVPEHVLDGDVNGVVDFRYSTSPRLTWWFDHHETGIVGLEERAHFARDRSGRKFYEPRYSSCCKLIRDRLREALDFHAPALDDLVAWADVIDAARFPTADAATRLDEPALELMAVIEVDGDSSFLSPYIERLSWGEPLAQVAASPEVRARLGPLRADRDRATRLVESRARCEDGVVTIDLVEAESDLYPKFLPYRLFPEAGYAVAVTVDAHRAKVGVGSNPWAPAPRKHDIAALCARYGGGGHPWVGAVSLPATEGARARRIAAEIAEVLREDARG